MLNWLLVHRRGPRFITQKLASTLSLVLIRFPNDARTIWPYPVHDVVSSLATGTPTVNSKGDLSTEQEFASMIAGLSIEDLDIAFLYSSTFAEEIQRADVPRQDR